MIHGAIIVYLAIGYTGGAIMCAETADTWKQAVGIMVVMSLFWLPLTLVLSVMFGFNKARYWWKGW